MLLERNAPGCGVLSRINSENALQGQGSICFTIHEISNQPLIIMGFCICKNANKKALLVGLVNMTLSPSLSILRSQQPLNHFKPNLEVFYPKYLHPAYLRMPLFSSFQAHGFNSCLSLPIFFFCLSLNFKGENVVLCFR